MIQSILKSSDHPIPRFPQLLRHLSAVAMFVAGFLFDFLTMQRIDAWRDLAFQLGYLVALTGLLVYQNREAMGRWTPGRLTRRWWQYNVQAVHFLYGGLLSAYVVLYFRSSTVARPAVFLVLLVGVMVINEVPHIRNAGYPLRLGLYGFCVFSFLDASTGGSSCSHCSCPQHWCGWWQAGLHRRTAIERSAGRGCSRRRAMCSRSLPSCMCSA
jgi:hypothetical protein